jgi:hypothetical protein
MKPIARDEILPIGEYEAVRPHFRGRVIEQKRRRRVRISDILSATFENRDTVLLQIQEMLRTERITSEAGIAHEIETYNQLIPGPRELSITLFVEIADAAERERMLEALAGLERHVALEVDGARFAARFEDRSVEGFARTTAVHYFKFELSEAAAASLSSAAAKVAIVVTHPAHQVRAELGPAGVRAIAEDLA